MVLIEGRRRDQQHAAPPQGQKRQAEDAAQAAAKQPRTDAPNLGAIIAAAQAAQAAHAQAGTAPGSAPSTAPALPATALPAGTTLGAPPAPGANAQTAAVLAALAAQQSAAATPPPPPNPGALAILQALGGAGAAGTATAPPAPTPGAPAPAASTLSPQAAAVIAALVAARQQAPPGAPAPTAPSTAPALPATALPAGTTLGAPPAPGANAQTAAVLAALAAQQSAAATPAPPPNPGALAILQALGGAGAAGTATAPPAPPGAPAPAASTLSPQAAAIIAALVAARQQPAAGVPGSSSLLPAPPSTAAPAAPPSGSGQIDLFAHLAASARINAAMNAAYQPAEEQPPPQAPEPAAFDKDALKRLAQRAAEGPIEELPPPPPPESKKPVETAPEAVEEPAPQVEEAEEDGGGAAAPEAEMNGAAQATPAPEVEVKKKDSSSIATMLSHAQSNVAKGKVPADKVVDTASLQQAFTIGGGASGNTFNVKGLTPLDSLCQRLESVGTSLGSEDRKDLQQQITALLPKLEPQKAADLVSRIPGAEGLRTAAFLDEIARLLPASRFPSPHLTRILAALASWAAAVSGSDADGKPKLSEDARSFFTTTAAELSLRLMDVAPRDLSQIANAMATIGQTEERFFASLARASVARCERFSVEDILLLCLAFDKAGLVHVPLLEAAAKLLRFQVSQVPGSDLARGLRSLATCCVRDMELGKAVGEYLAQGPKGGLTPEEFCSLAWTFVTLGFYHDQMFRAVFKALEDAPTMPGDTLCQLYEIHMALKVFRDDFYSKYELEESVVQSLRAHYRKQRGGKLRDMKLERSVEKVCKDIGECLQKVVIGSVSRQHQTELGMAVDIAVTAKRASKPIVFIEVDGSHSLMKTLDLTGPSPSQVSRVRGPVLLKRYLLQKHGFRIAVVPEDFWRSLGDTREKRDFLRELLRSAGVPSKLL